MIADIGLKYKISDSKIPDVEYTEEELGVWQHCYPKLKNLLMTNACDETIEIIKEFE